MTTPLSLYLWPLLAGCAAAAVASWLATGVMLRALKRLELFDRPNERSSHSEARPRGGGLAVVPVLLLAWVVAAIWLGGGWHLLWGVLAGTLLVAAVSWRDDLGHLPAGWRLLAQAVAVALGLLAFRDPAAVFQGWLPVWLAYPVAGLAWLWFVNLFNFMDGIDGISGVESLCLCLGVVVLAQLLDLPAALTVLPALLAAAMLGFLPWNWAPAKLFLGDVGSVPLGFLLGWLLLRLAAEGAWAAALILPAYYLADATLTLIWRALRGQRPWEAHREHGYQRAVDAGHGHGRIATLAGLCGLALVVLAGFSPEWPLATLVGTAALVLAFLAVLLLLARSRSGR